MIYIHATLIDILESGLKGNVIIISSEEQISLFLFVKCIDIKIIKVLDYQYN